MTDPSVSISQKTKKQSMEQIPVKETILRSLIYSLLLIVFATSTLMTVYLSIKKSILENINKSHLEEIHTMEEYLQNDLKDIDLSLYNIAKTDTSIRALKNRDKKSIQDAGSLMLTINEYRKDFDQLRLIDTEGQEILRVNLKADNSSYLVPPSQLQNKKDRYYFKESMKLGLNEIYMSAFDLNIEQGKVESPYKPMIRFSRKVTDAQGKTQGIAIINYLGARLLETLDKHNVRHGDQWYLINGQGYYLKGPRKDLDFAFMFAEKSDLGLFSEHPDLWSMILTNSEGKWENTQGYYYFKKINPLPNAVRSGSAVQWTIVMHVPHAIVLESQSLLIRSIKISAFISYPLLILLGILLSISRTRSRWLFNELKKQADLDELTGLLNRRAIITKLEYLINLVRRNSTDLSVVFADINDLKLINDLNGHDAGDKMILAATSAFLKEIRATDIAARIGGDEFLIVFPGCDPGKAQLIMERVLYHFEESGRRNNGQAWKLSWGSAHWQGKHDTLDALVNRADEKMYEMKKKLKGINDENDLSVAHIPFPD